MRLELGTASLTIYSHPIWAYWACFTSGSSARDNFFIFLSQQRVWDAPPTLHWWRKVGRDGEKKSKEEKGDKEKKSIIQRDSNPRLPDNVVWALPLCYNRSLVHLHNYFALLGHSDQASSRQLLMKSNEVWIWSRGGRKMGSCTSPKRATMRTSSFWLKLVLPNGPRRLFSSNKMMAKLAGLNQERD